MVFFKQYPNIGQPKSVEGAGVTHGLPVRVDLFSSLFLPETELKPWLILDPLFYWWVKSIHEQCFTSDNA